MPELRRDAITGRAVILAANRAQRPDEFASTAPDTDGPCPFCAVNIDQHTPPPVATYYSGPDGIRREWQVRVVPNLYPAVEPGPRPSGCDGLGSQQSWPARGRHEVVIESPRHLRSLTELTDAEVALVFRAYRDRTRDMERDKQVAYALAFKNVGPAAGASLEHIHSQIVGLPLVPPVMHEELQGAAKFFAIQRDCVFCHLIQQELLARRRIVVRVEQFVAICPYASRFPYEVWVLPERHSASFQHSPDAQLAGLARTARCILSALERGCGITAYNFLIHSSPFDIDCQDHYHWHMEIIPRTVKAAGFEWGTGMQINPVLPEEAADQLRNAIA